MTKYTWRVYHLSTCIYVLVHIIFGLVFIYIHILQNVRAAEKVWWNFKNAQANLSRGTCDKWQNLMNWHIYEYTFR